jgi:uncharacterized protein DUF4388
VSAEHDGGGKRLLDLLLERGLVDRGQLLEALRLQTYRLLLQLLRWDQGEFKFYSGEEVAFEEGFYAISVEELLIRSLSDLGDDGQVGGPPDLAVAYERVSGGPTIRYVGKDGVAEGPGAWVAAEDRAFVERLDGRTVAGVLANETGVGQYRALFTLYKLLRAGAVRALPKAATAQAPVRPPAPAVSAPRAPAAAPAPPRPTLVAVPAPAAAPAPAPTPSPLPSRPAAQIAAVPAPKLLPKRVDELDETASMSAPERRRKVVVLRPPEKKLPAIAVVAPALVAGLFALVLFASPWLGPRRLLLPFPWQETMRTGLERNQRTAQYLKIDRAARTYFLLEGHYPDGLQELVTRRLLEAGDLVDPSGRRLGYTAEDLSYELQPMVAGEPIAELGVREAISGDFLIDPDFLEVPEAAERPPLVLLD